MAKPSASASPDPAFIDNPAIAGRGQNFATVTVALAPVLASWRESLFAHEWLNPNGTLKAPDQQKPEIRDQRLLIDKKIHSGAPLERPVLGIGIMDNIEIGSGRDTLLTLAAAGLNQIPVHIPRSHLDEFRPFIKD